MLFHLLRVDAVNHRAAPCLGLKERAVHDVLCLAGDAVAACLQLHGGERVDGPFDGDRGLVRRRPWGISGVRDEQRDAVRALPNLLIEEERVREQLGEHELVIALLQVRASLEALGQREVGERGISLNRCDAAVRVTCELVEDCTRSDARSGRRLGRPGGRWGSCRFWVGLEARDALITSNLCCPGWGSIIVWRLRHLLCG